MTYEILFGGTRESIPVIGTQIPGKQEFEISFPGIPGMTGVTPGSHSDHEETCLKCSSSVVRRVFVHRSH